jgi:FKBP-type peptidyl-prolyl cis-trans isomerase 2
MTTAKKGDTVRVEYTGKLADGTVFDSSEGRLPLEFKLGEGQVIPGFEQAVEGMAEGESRTASVGPDEAYGQADPRLQVAVPKNDFPDSIDPEVGQQLQIRQPDGSSIPVAVVGVSDEAVTLDANHPLAGKELTFDLKLVEVL